jgi:hypothetical protein
LRKHFLADDDTDGKLWSPQLPHFVAPRLAPFSCALYFHLLYITAQLLQLTQRLTRDDSLSTWRS